MEETREKRRIDCVVYNARENIRFSIKNFINIFPICGCAQAFPPFDSYVPRVVRILLSPSPSPSLSPIKSRRGRLHGRSSRRNCYRSPDSLSPLKQRALFNRVVRQRIKRKSKRV